MNVRESLEVTECMLMEVRNSLKKLETGLWELFLAFVENLPESIAILNQDMKYVIVTRSWRKDFHLQTEEIVGASHSDFFPGFPENLKIIEQKCLAGSAKINMMGPIRKSDGEEFLVNWIVCPWIEKNGAMAGMIIQNKTPSEAGEIESPLSSGHEWN